MKIIASFLIKIDIVKTEITNNMKNTQTPIGNDLLTNINKSSIFRKSLYYELIKRRCSNVNENRRLRAELNLIISIDFFLRVGFKDNHSMQKHAHSFKVYHG